jgi:hypothetical protein
LLKRLAEINKEEKIENDKEEEHDFLFDDEIDINTKVKRKRNTEDMVFDDVIESMDLTEYDKIFWRQNSSSMQTSFCRSTQIMIFYISTRSFINQTENIIHLFY